MLEAEDKFAGLNFISSTNNVFVFFMRHLLDLYIYIYVPQTYFVKDKVNRKMTTSTYIYGVFHFCYFDS